MAIGLWSPGPLFKTEAFAKVEVVQVVVIAIRVLTLVRSEEGVDVSVPEAWYLLRALDHPS